MRNEDVSAQAQFATTPQSEAVQNIQGGEFFEINPEAFKNNKVELLPTMKAATQPNVASPLLATEISRSPEHASAYMPDLLNYKFVENQFTKMAESRVSRDPAARADDSFFGGLADRIGGAMALQNQATQASDAVTKAYADYTKQRVVNRLGPEQRLTQLNWDKMQAEIRGEQLGDDSNAELTSLRLQQKTQFGTSSYGFDTFAQQLPADVIAAGVDLPAMMTRNKEVVASIVGAYAGYGALTGAAATGPAAPAGAAAGAATALIPGAITAFTAASFIDSYKQTAAATYGYLDEATDEAGRPINMDATTKAELAHGVGMINGALGAVADRAVLKNLPWLRTLTGSAAAQRIARMASNDPIKIAILGMGRAAMINGAQGGFQEFSQIVAENIGQTYKDGEASFVNGLQNAVSKVATEGSPERERVLRGTGTGIATGLALQTGTELVAGVARKGATKIRDDLRARRQGPGDEPPALGGVRDVGPEPQGPPPTDIVNPKDPISSVIDVLEFQDTLDASREVTQKSKLFSIAPGESIQLRKQLLQNADTKYVWFNPDDLKTFANTEEKAQAVREAFSISEAVENQKNVPMRVDLVDLLPLHDKFPTISEYAKLNPEGPSPNAAKDYAARIQEQEQKRTDLRTRLGAIEQTTVEDRAASVKIKAEMSDEEIGAALGTKEVADVYLQSLAARETELRTPKKSNVVQIKKADTGFINGETGEPISESDLADLLSQSNKVEDNENKIRSAQDQMKFYMRNPKTEAEAIAIAEKIDWGNDWKFHYGSPEEIGKALWSQLEGLKQRTPENLAWFHGLPFAEGDTHASIQQKLMKQNVDELSGRREKIQQEAIDEANQRALNDLDPEVRQEIVQIEDLRDRVTALRDSLSDDKTAAGVIRQSLEDPSVMGEDIIGEAQFMSVPDWTAKELQGVFPKGMLERWKGLELAARDDMMANFIDTAIYEQNKVIDVNEALAMEVELETQAQRLETDPNIAVVERFKNAGTNFTPTERYRNVADLTDAHAREGFSPFAIDKRLLTEEQRNKYRDDLALKKHKAFVKGGISPDQAALLLGVPSGDQLLEILSKTPDRAAAIKQAAELRRPDIRAEAVDSTPLNEIGLNKATNSKIKNGLAILHDMIDSNLSTVRGGLMKIALQKPKIEEITSAARAAVEQTKLSDLDINKHVVAERKSQRKSLDAGLRGQYLEMAVQKRNAIENTAMANEMRIARTKANRNIRFMVGLNKKKNRAIFKEAGGVIEGAYDELMTMYNFSGKEKDTVARGKYAEWVASEIENGRGNFEIPERFQDIRTNASEMTVEELQVITDRARALYKSAKMKNKLYNEFGDSSVQTLGHIVNEGLEKLRAHPDRDIRKKYDPQGDRTFWQSKGRMISHGAAGLRDFNHLLQWLDNDEVGGWFQSNIGALIRGQGKFKGQGLEYENALNAQFNDRDQALIEQFGKREYEDLKAKRVFVPEFAKSMKLSEGSVSQWDLYIMWLNMGNEGNRKRLVEGFADDDGFTTDAETIMKVINRELKGEKWRKLVQGQWDIFKAIQPLVEKHHLEMTGVQMEVVEPTPIEHEGFVMAGGYYPIRYASQMSVPKMTKGLSNDMAMWSGEKSFKLTDKFYTEDMTRHGHTEKRTESTGEPLSLSVPPGAMIASMTHDLALRKPISDAMRIVTHPEMAKEIANVIGIENANVFLNSIVDIANHAAVERGALFEPARLVTAFRGAVTSTMAAGWLTFKAGTFGVQFTSLAYAAHKMGGPGRAGHMTKMMTDILSDMTSNPKKFHEYVKFAGEIHPPIRDVAAGLEDSQGIASAMVGRVPKKFPLHNMTKYVYKASTASTEKGFQLLGVADNIQKTVVVLTAYNQFMSGDAPGWTYEKLRKLSPDEREHRARVYASNTVFQSLTSSDRLSKAPLQKVDIAADFTMFYSDARNVLGNSLAVGRSVRNATKEAGREFKRGNTKGSFKKMKPAAGGLIGLALTMALAKLLEDTIRNLGKDEEYQKETPLNGQMDGPVAEQWMKYIAAAPADVFINTLPVARDFNWMTESSTEANRYRKEYTTPLTRGLTNAWRASMVMLDIMENPKDFIKGDLEVDPRDYKPLGYTLGMLTGLHFPVDAVMNGYDYLSENPVDLAPSGLIDRVQSMFPKWQKEQEGLPKGERVPDDVAKAMEEYMNQINGQDPTSAVSNEIPEDTYSIIRKIESNDNIFAVNPRSSAAGLYQFTVQTWNRIMNEAPELDLTEEGRVSDKPDQQEKAMAYYTETNVRALRAANLEPTIENIYAAHFLGADKAVEVLQAKPTDKMKSIVGKDVMEANEFANGLKVRDFKTWLKTQVQRASSVDVAGAK